MTGGIKRLRVVAITGVILTQVGAFLTSPPDALMGHLQKIMYVHVPSAWVMMLAFFIVFVYSVLYLWKRNPLHDLAAASAAEVGTVFTALTLIQGSIWGRPTWGVWWVWDPRLTTTAVLILIYAGYLALRSFTDDEERRARWCAAVGVLGFINVWIVFMSVRWWRTLHQPQSSPSTMSSEYLWGLVANSLSFAILLAWLIRERYEIAKLEQAKELQFEEASLSGLVQHV